MVRVEFKIQNSERILHKGLFYIYFLNYQQNKKHPVKSRKIWKKRIHCCGKIDTVQPTKRHERK